MLWRYDPDCDLTPDEEEEMRTLKLKFLGQQITVKLKFLGQQITVKLNVVCFKIVFCRVKGGSTLTCAGTVTFIGELVKLQVLPSQTLFTFIEDMLYPIHKQQVQTLLLCTFSGQHFLAILNYIFLVLLRLQLFR